MAGNNNNMNNNNHGEVQVVISYKECRRNHALPTGGFVVDGCREFTPSGGPGTDQAMLCQACACHRSFHRQELVPPPQPRQLFRVVPVMMLRQAPVANNLPQPVLPQPQPPPQPENSDGEIDYEHVRPRGHLAKRIKRNPF